MELRHDACRDESRDRHHRSWKPLSDEMSATGKPRITAVTNTFIPTKTLRKSGTESKPPESAATPRTYSYRSLPALVAVATQEALRPFSSVKNVAGSMTTRATYHHP